MSRIHHVIFSFLLCSVNFLLSMESDKQEYQRRKIRLQPLYAPNIPEINNTFFNQQPISSFQSCRLKHSLKFNKDEIKEMEMVLEHAPIRAQNIIKCLNNPHFSTNYSCASFFVGIPGSGKTTFAKAIAYKMQQIAQWENQFITSSSVLGEHRNKTAIQLCKIFEEITLSPNPQILIIDELNQLLEHSNSEHHDTDSTSKAIWSFLDKQSKNRKFFFIGIMNAADKLPQPFKSRMLGNCIFFSCITDKSLKNKIFRSKFSSENSQLHDEVNDAYLSAQFDRLTTCTGRDLCNIAVLTENIYRDYDQESDIIIHKKHLNEALGEYLKTVEEIKYNKIEETAEEKQERHHKENIALQKSNHKESQESQEKHFVQQQLIQVTIQDNLSIGSTYHCISEIGKKELASLISDEQKKLYVDMMANTRARKAHDEQVAAAKAAADAAQKAANAGKWFWQ